MYAVPQGSYTKDAIEESLVGDFKIHQLSTDTAINGSNPGRRLLTYAGVLAITLLAPVAGTDDGKKVQVISAVSQANTVTCTGHLLDGAGHSNTATFSANPGASFTVVAYNGNWLVTESIGITFS